MRFYSRPGSYGFAALGCLFLISASGSRLGAQQQQEMEDVIVTFSAHAPNLTRVQAALAGRQTLESVRSAIDDVHADATRQRAGFAGAIEGIGGKVRQHYWLINASRVSIPVGKRPQVAGMEGVTKVWRNETRAPADFPVPIRVATNANNHRVDGLQSAGVLGAGVTVAIVDAGLDSQMGTSGRPHAVFYPDGDPTNRTGSGLSGSRLLANVQIGNFPPDNPTVSHGTRVAASAIGGRWNSTAEADHGHAPGASVVGYSLSDFANGATELQTMVGAWQQLVLDRASYGTSVANMSYRGSSQVDSPEQQAMDAAVQVADLLVTVSAGSQGSAPSFHAAVNVLAVGAAVADTHTVPSWSAVGPLADLRVYPHLIANGENLFTPEIDDESVNTQSNGASHAAPQVAGAAALFRSVNVNASAVETRAAILATTEDVSDRATLNNSGHGYLRDDRLVALAQGVGFLQSGSVDSLRRQRSYSMAVIGGDTYAVAMSWNRQLASNLTWANLDLEIRQDGELLVESARVRDSNERVKFRARNSGSVEIRVKLQSLEPGTPGQSFALAGAAAPDAIVSGEWRRYGVGCPGVAGAPNRGVETTPVNFDAVFGTAGTNGLLGGAPHRFQMVPRQIIRAAQTIHAIALRFDDGATSGQGLQWVDLEIEIGQTPGDLFALRNTFAGNRTNNVAMVVSRRRVMLPPQPNPNTMPREWTVVIPLDQSISTYPDRGGLLVDVRVYGSSPGLNYPVDASSDMTRVLYAANPAATTGTVGNFPLPIVGLVTNPIPGAIPSLSASGQPDLGQTFAPTLTGAVANAPILLVTGNSGTSSGGLALPFNLGLFGAPRCFLAASLDVVSRRTADATGSLALSFTIPQLPSLVGATFYQQALCVDPVANALGLTSSNGIVVTIGGR